SIPQSTTCGPAWRKCACLPFLGVECACRQKCDTQQKCACASLRPPRSERNGRGKRSSGLGELVEELLLVGVVELRHEGDGLDLGEAFVEAWLHVLLLEPVIVGQV